MPGWRRTGLANTSFEKDHDGGFILVPGITVSIGKASIDGNVALPRFKGSMETDDKCNLKDMGEKQPVNARLA